MNRWRALIPLLGVAVLLTDVWWGTRKGPGVSRERDRSIHVGKATEGISQPPSNNTATRQVPDEPQSTRRRKPETANSLSRLMPDGRTRGRISKPVIEDFLTRSERSAKALLTAFRESGDRSYLEEAAVNFPKNPVVQLAMINDPDSRAEREKWIAAFQDSVPDNALADYFAALAAFQRKDGAAANQELVEASRKSVFDEYLWDVADELEALYLAGGLRPAEAKAMASFSIPLPHLAEFQTLGAEMQAAHDSYHQAGDATRANEMLSMHLSLGRALSDEPAATLIHRLVGFAIERKAIENAPPAALVEVSGNAGSDRLTEIREMREEILQSSRTVDITLAQVSDDELMLYFDMLRAQGELAALKWLEQQTRSR